MYRYETHLHTSPVSKCGHATVEENVDFYKSMGYDGIFVTNHFLDGNINVDQSLSYKEKINYYFNDYERAFEYGKKVGLKVFCGVEITYKGTDFLVYGLDKEWYLKHEKIMYMEKREELDYLRKKGALVIQAHPYRRADYIDHIRLYPDNVDGMEVLNANRTPLENKMAEIMVEEYGHLKTAGTDNHLGPRQKKFAGMESDTPIVSEEDFIQRVRDNTLKIFRFDLE